MNQSKLYFFTVVARNYLALAYVLGQSIKDHHPDAEFGIFVMDDTERLFSQEISQRGFSEILPSQIAVPDYLAFVFKYNITEASTAVKPFIFASLFAQGAEKVIYLDPDILCYRQLTEVLELLETHSLVLTPHSTGPIEANRYPDDLLFLTSGVYNLGFLAVRHGAVAEKFIAWWSDKLQDQCLEAREMSLFVDQKWMDLVPAYFEEVYILKSLAYNIAYWNFHERFLRKTDEILEVQPSGEAVAFIHFSGFDTRSLNNITKYKSRNPFDIFGQQSKERFSLKERPDLQEPFQQYAALLANANHGYYSQLPYAYSCYENGDLISPFERVLFWIQSREPDYDQAPFAVTPNSFWRQCRDIGLAKSTGLSASFAAMESEQSYAGFTRVIQHLLRLLVKRLGPDRYSKFAKYMRHQFLLQNHGFLLKKTLHRP